MSIVCPHPRPELNLPARTPPRLRWSPPSTIPGLPPEAARVLRQALQGIYDEMMQRFATSTVVPLLDATQQVRAGQTIRGVANGQTLVMPIDAPGTQEPVTVIVTDVVSPVTIAYPDGTTDTLSTPGVYEFEPSGDAPTWATTALASGSIPLGSLAPIADETFVGNVSGAPASPSAIALSTLAGGGLAWDAANNEIDVGAGTRITVNANDVQLATGIADSFLMNATAGVAVADYRAGTSVAGAGLTYTTGGTLAVGSSTSITVNADDVQRSALTGDITAALNSNTTAFRSFVGLSVLARAPNTSGVPTELTAVTANHLLKVNNAGTALVFEALALTAFPTGAADTFLGNFTAGVATPTFRAGTSIAGAGLTYTTGGTLAVGAGTGITVNADDVQLAALAAETFFGNFTAGSAVGTARAGTSVAGAGLTYTAGGTLAVGAGTNVTVNADDIAVNNYPLSGLATQAANTYVANGTAGVAAPTAIAVSAESIPARTSGNLSQLTSSAQSILMRSSGSLFFGTAAADQVLRRSGSGDLGFGTLVTNNIGDDQVTFPKMVNIATDSLIGRDTAGTGDPENITLGNGLEMTGASALRVDEDADFTWQGIHDFSNEIRANDTGSIALTSGASNNNMAIAGNSNFLVFLTGVLAGTTDLTGIAAPSGSGKRLMFVLNNCTGTSVWVRNQSASSTAANRIQCPTPTSDIELATSDWMILFYTGSQWNVVSHVQGLAANTVAANALSVAGKARGLAVASQQWIGRQGGNLAAINLSALGNSATGVSYDAASGNFQTVAASQAEMEAVVELFKPVVPARQHLHPGSIKAWVNNQITTTINRSYNVSSVTDTAVGDHTINTSVTFSDANGIGMMEASADQSALATQCTFRGGFATTNTYRLRCYSFGDVSAGTAPALRDPALYCIGMLGDI